MKLLYKAGDLLRHKARLRKWNPAHAWGRRGEDIAHRFLRGKGMQVVARNYRTANGSSEVDLVAWEGPAIVFVEVKTRASDEFGEPADAVDTDKKRQIVAAATDYLRRAALPWKIARFDVGSIVLEPEQRVTHIRDAFLHDTSI